MLPHRIVPKDYFCSCKYDTKVTGALTLKAIYFNQTSLVCAYLALNTAASWRVCEPTLSPTTAWRPDLLHTTGPVAAGIFSDVLKATFLQADSEYRAQKQPIIILWTAVVEGSQGCHIFLTAQNNMNVYALPSKAPYNLRNAKISIKEIFSQPSLKTNHSNYAWLLSLRSCTKLS